MFLGWYVDAYPASAFYAMSKRMKAGDVCDDIGFAGIKKYGRLAYRRKKPITDAQERKQVADVIDRIRQRIRIEASGLWPPPPRGSLTRAIVEAGLWSLMPRIDREVTEQPGHLLKAPLTLHPLTKKLAIFVKQADLATFVPSGDGSDAPARLADFDEWLSRK
jgi:DNA primase catalytic subunit